MQHFSTATPTVALFNRHLHVTDNLDDIISAAKTIMSSSSSINATLKSIDTGNTRDIERVHKKMQKAVSSLNETITKASELRNTFFNYMKSTCSEESADKTELSTKIPN